MSLLNYLLNLIGIKKISLQKKEELSTQEKLEKEKLEAARQSMNRLTYGDETRVVFPAEQGFYGAEDNPGLNWISLFFETEETDKSCYLTFNLYVAPNQKEALPGNYRQYDTPREMSMDGEISFYWGEDEEEDIPLIDGRLHFKQIGEKYLITADCLCENKEKLTLYYEGPLKYHNYAPGKNGKGYFLYEDKEYPLYVGLEEYEGIISDYTIPSIDVETKFPFPEGYYTDLISIDLKLRDHDTSHNHYLSFQLFQKKGDKILPGEYTCEKNSLNISPNTFIGYMGILDENEDEEKDIFLKMTGGSIKITRNQAFTIEGVCELENRKTVSFSYTGNPEWYDES